MLIPFFQRLVRKVSAGCFRRNTRVNPVLFPFPSMVMIDTTTRCNLGCIHCPNRQLKERPGFVGDMEVGLYRKIIDEISEENKGTVIRPFDGGEPLMRKDMEELIHYAKSKGIEHVSINSNGLLLCRDRCLTLLESGLDHIEISIDAATEDTYRKIRGSDRYGMLLDNVHQLLALRLEKKSDLKVSVSFVRQEFNREEQDAFVDYWTGKVESVYIRQWHQHNHLVEGEGWHGGRIDMHRHPCPYLWDRLIVHHDGKVRFCESDWECRYPVGDINCQTISEIWTGENYRRLRESHLSGTFDHPFCRDCSDWRVITW